MKRTITLIVMLCIIGMANIAIAQEVKINTGMAVESDGTVRLDGAATTWNDLVVPATAVRIGSGNSPTFEVIKGGVQSFTFSSSANQEVFFTVQMPHNWKEGTTIYPHVHWSPQGSTTGVVVWGLEYTWANYDPSTPVTFPNTIITNAISAAVTSGDNDKHYIASFPALIPLTTVTPQDKISSILVCRFFRDAISSTDTYAGKVVMLSFDFHYEIDSFGSHTAFVK
jgi:hypothetical protein